ncbi:hypothetical protein [Anoxynatronum buryatiense]|nr:hypothetical protein [Anoxynatronum buryatiense]
MNIPKFKAENECMKYDQLLHYSNIETLRIMLDERTLKCNSLKNVNDLLERQRKGIEEQADATYVSCFSHCQYETVPFWYLYGGSECSNKVLLRFNNVAKSFGNAIKDDWAFTGDKKCIFYNPKDLFSKEIGGISYDLKNDSCIESSQTILAVRLFDVKYVHPDNEVLTKNYKTNEKMTFAENEVELPAEVNDVRTIGKYKTIHWKYEAETRIQCILRHGKGPCLEHILLRLKDDFFRDMVIVSNPWASDAFLRGIKTVLEHSNLPKEIKETITVQRSELDGQIVGCNR